MLTVGTAVRVKDGKKGRPKKWYIVKFDVGDDVLNDIAVLENEKHEQLTVSVDDVIPYPVKLGVAVDSNGNARPHGE